MKFQKSTKIFMLFSLIFSGMFFAEDIKNVEASSNTIKKLTSTVNLHLYSINSTKIKMLLTIPKRKSVTYLSKSGSWYKVKYKGKTGWVSSKYIKVTITAKTTASNTNTTNKTNTTTTRPIVIAHRGANDSAPEHSLLAYKLAIEKKADYIEIDLRLSKDNQLVAIHDETVDRTTNGKGKVIDFTLSQLKQLDLGNRQKIPSLEEIFSTFGKTTKYYIETRTLNGNTVMEEKLLNLISKYGLEKQVIIESFSQDSLKKISSLNKNIPLIYLVLGDSLKNINIIDLKKYAVGVGPYGKQIDKKFVDKMHSENLQVHAWFDSSNEKKLIGQVLLYGVDGLFTDYLDNTNRILNN